MTYETVKTACNKDFLDVHWDKLMDAAWNTGCFIRTFYFTYEIRVWRCVIVYDSFFFLLPYPNLLTNVLACRCRPYPALD